MIEPEPEVEVPVVPQRQFARRKILTLATGATALLAGAGAALWSLRKQVAREAGEPIEGFWSLHWETPRGAPLKLETYRGHPILLNFWATWCTPCVEEFPLINSFYNQNRANGWQVIGLALDKVAPVQSFLRAYPVDFPIGMAGLAGGELSRSLGNLGGSLPFTVVVGSSGEILARKMGRLTAEDLAQWAQLK